MSLASSNCNAFTRPKVHYSPNMHITVPAGLCKGPLANGSLFISTEVKLVPALVAKRVADNVGVADCMDLSSMLPDHPSHQLSKYYFEHPTTGRKV